MRFLENELSDFFILSKDLDSSTLVQRSRFYQPNVFLTVLERYTLMFGPSLVEFSESVHEVFDTDVVEILCYYESCGG